MPGPRLLRLCFAALPLLAAGCSISWTGSKDRITYLGIVYSSEETLPHGKRVVVWSPGLSLRFTDLEPGVTVGLRRSEFLIPERREIRDPNALSDALVALAAEPPGKADTTRDVLVVASPDIAKATVLDAGDVGFGLSFGPAGGLILGYGNHTVLLSDQLPADAVHEIRRNPETGELERIVLLTLP